MLGRCTANHRYADRTDLIVVEIDPTRLDEPVVVEDRYGTGEGFPHVYGAIPTKAAVGEHPLPRDSGGQFTFAV
jgi:uncharacterized protein (DUF952 family)